ncbi:MAG: AmmeMemoRadiSam system radical SAM enzyme [Thermoplasmata archaeon]|nr:MAG: AmmeMemoRadiSam system radical SAM enzyme [Thermoplasmata archaeon]
MKEAQFWEKEGEKVHCLLCPHNCKISEGKRGICGVRVNENGVLNTLIYGMATSVTPDPIEKKPLYHFYPGTYVLSFGTVGCNLKCLHCQNHSISQADFEGMRFKRLEKEKVVDTARRYKCDGIAWTYNEPTIWYEFTYDASVLAKEAGLYTCYVTNGFIEKEPLEKISPYLDAMNVDVKAFKDDFYKKICKAKLQPVLETCKRAKELGILIELTYLIIPQHNDSEPEISEFSTWVADDLGEDTPVHFSRFHPDYKMLDASATPMSTLGLAHDIAKKAGLKHVYLGNVPHGDYENTFCPQCGELLIERVGFSTRGHYVQDGKCPKCGQKIPLRE